jgi:hypothetical protein
MNFAINILDKINSNSGTVSVTGNTVGTVVESTRHGGFDDEIKKYSITGSVTSGVATTIATISITARGNSFFIKQPYISFNENVKLIRTSVTKVSNVGFNSNIKNISKYNFDLIYNNTVATYKLNNINLYLNYKDHNENILNGSGGIDKLVSGISFGDTILPRLGENRKIIVYGKPGAGFILQINEADEIYNDAGTLLSVTETSILDPNLSIDTRGNGITAQSAIKQVDSRHGHKINALSGTIGPDGQCSFIQVFPNNIVLSKKLNGSMSDTAIMDLDDTIGIRETDQVIMKEITEKSDGSTRGRYRVKILTSGTRIVTNVAITAADNVMASFARKRNYYIYLTAKNTSSLASSVPTTEPTYKLTQPLDPILSIKTSKHANFATSASVNGTSLGSVTANNHHYTYWKGKANITSVQMENDSTISSYHSLTYTIDSDGGTSFAINNPTGVFDKTEKLNNSIITGYSDAMEKGYSFDIFNIKTVLSGSGGNDIATITFNLIINKFGTEDHELELDFEKLITIS